MKNKSFNAKSFLNAKTLSPLDESKIRGGLSADGVKVSVKETVKETVTETN
ncbi:hypothetical protein SAMN05421866_0314 [Chryseobacterium oranimense]|jgi:hypothetical protein|uniref:Uncharacterized protein n=1 Tax=Chryseobacterium oranimense TaxID=421058 RepID=A0A1M5JHW4_9FLAO|nr:MULTISPECIES: hypothetical protein [Chryseobacterium]CEJ69013.1 hypothetical protein BN1195_01305 [Chryseobacterium oranimense G311]SHG40131.1 hypothetical protein SAMN05421866_0314 [Chryseobacterium oranimense]